MLPKIVLSVSLALSLATPVAVQAATEENSPLREKAREFVGEMTERYGFDRAWLEKQLAAAQRQQAIIDAMQRPAEKTLEWGRYRSIFLKPKRIESGVQFLNEHQETFARAEEEFGVPRQFIAAIIGVETWYGRFRGNYRVIDALTTLAFDYPPRAEFFRSELAQFFLLTREQGFDAQTVMGSYAGAMGYGQFISSSYRHYAIDFDGDGVVDLLGNPVDAIGSVGEYFRAHDWRAGEPVAKRVYPANAIPEELLTEGLRPSLTLKDYRAAGLDVEVDLPDSAPARLIRLQADDGEQFWLTFHNFYVVTRYNHSHLYAMAVTELASRLTEATTMPGDGESELSSINE